MYVTSCKSLCVRACLACAHTVAAKRRARRSLRSHVSPRPMPDLPRRPRQAERRASRAPPTPRPTSASFAPFSLLPRRRSKPFPFDAFRSVPFRSLSIVHGNSTVHLGLRLYVLDRKKCLCTHIRMYACMCVSNIRKTCIPLRTPVYRHTCTCLRMNVCMCTYTERTASSCKSPAPKHRSRVMKPSRFGEVC